MAIVDDRGRLLGRFNVVDVFVFILVVVMIPMAYAAYALFRAPAAKLTRRGAETGDHGSESPRSDQRPQPAPVHARVLQHRAGADLHDWQHRNGGSRSADLEPGAYDVVLYGYAQEVDRLPGALTILPRVPAPTATLAVHGVFVGLTETQAASLTTGTKFAQNNRVSATVLAVGTRHSGAMQMRTGETSVGISLPGVYDVPAALQLECFLENTGDGSVRCVYYGPLHPSFVATDSILPLPIAGGPLNFQVSDVHPTGTPTYLRVRVRTAIAPDIAARLRVGDSDSQVPDYAGAWIGRVESSSGADIVLRLPAQQFSNGWKYRNQWLKVNGGIRFETPTSVINGTVVDIRASRSDPPEMIPEPREHDLLDVAIRDSITGRIAASAAGVWSRAWRSSALGAFVTSRQELWQRLSGAQRIRAIAITGAVAMIVDRAMALAVPAEPLSAVLPSLVLVACIAAAVFAEPLARVVGQLRR